MLSRKEMVCGRVAEQRHWNSTLKAMESHWEGFTWRLASVCVLEDSVANRRAWVRHEAGDQLKAMTGE